jgi:hypothetical protein
LTDLLIVTPPFTQLNTPYPASTYLKGFLNTKQIASTQMDLGIDVILALFSKDGLKRMFDSNFVPNQNMTANARFIDANSDLYALIIDDVIRFLQGKNPALARQICAGNFLPEASRFSQLNDMDWAFGNMGMQDKAKHMATLFLEDISDFIVECIDDHFGFSRYAERLGRSANSFDELHKALGKALSLIDELTINILQDRINLVEPKLLCVTVPFPGNLFSAFRCAQFLKEKHPSIKTAMGGGFPNTELRSIKDPRVFQFFDFITLDDGELPIELLHRHVCTPSDKPEFKRTFLIENGAVVFKNNSPKADYKQSEIGTPDYSNLTLENYISVIEVANPMHSLWSDGQWLKLTMAHGCYWGKCTFCDISLDYIKLYEPIAARTLVDRMQQMMEQTGNRGFHFVDEAAPPALMRELALEIIRRKMVVTWWTNIRFEKSFTRDLCLLLKASGCIAVSGGLEVASDRLLTLIQKGVTVAQVAQVTNHFTEAGIMVHAYLMYGYPTQTVQETIDSLELVRQMFELGIIQSGFWHQFALTAHSPIGLDPKAFGIEPMREEIRFADNDVQFEDSTGIDHDQFSFGLKKSLYNFMHDQCFEYPLQAWFDFKIPKTKIKHSYIEECLTSSDIRFPKSSAKVYWLGSLGEQSIDHKTKNGRTIELCRATFYGHTKAVNVSLDTEKAKWLERQLTLLQPTQSKGTTLSEIKRDYEKTWDDFEPFWFSKELNRLREAGLLLTI